VSPWRAPMKPQGADSYTIEIYAYLMFVYVWPSPVCHDCSLLRVMASRNLDFRVARKQIIAFVISFYYIRWTLRNRRLKGNV